MRAVAAEHAMIYVAHRGGVGGGDDRGRRELEMSGEKG